MLQHLANLRTSVARFAPVYHPWVRNLSKQDRWVIYINADGDPTSVTLVPAADAKFLVTVARDNFNCFPSFQGASLPLRFAGELLEIYSESPMARLLSSVTKIRDPKHWWADVQKLIQRAAVDEKYKGVENFALDLPGDDSVIQQSMRGPLSECLFAWEARKETGNYETGTAPRPNLPVLGLSYLISRNVDIPSLKRYGMEGLSSYPVHRQTVREMAACLEWITKEERRGKTWQAIPGKDKDSRDLLVIYLSGNPDVQARLADFFGDLEEPVGNQEVYYAALSESVTRFFSDENVKNLTQDRWLDLIVLRKVSPGVTRVETHLQPSIQEVKRVISDWQTALHNVPFPMFRTRYIPPGQMTRTLRRHWIRSGERYTDRRWEMSALYDIMFSRSSARPLVEVAYQSGKALLLSQSQSRHQADHLSAIGLSLWYAGHSKEQIVENIAFKLGRFLQLVDLLHKQYCVQERRGSLPSQLLGNAHFETVSQSPAKGLAMMQSRLKLYQGFAQTRGDGLSKWALAQLGELSVEIATGLPASLSTEEKAQMLLGYLARTPSTQVDTGTSATVVNASTAAA